MRHFAAPSFWDHYRALPAEVQRFSDEAFNLLKRDPFHPSLHLKKAGGYWSVRIGLQYRALAEPAAEGLLWFWIGTHADYDRIIRQPR